MLSICEGSYFGDDDILEQEPDVIIKRVLRDAKGFVCLGSLIFGVEKFYERSDPKGHGVICIFGCENIFMVF